MSHVPWDEVLLLESSQNSGSDNKKSTTNIDQDDPDNDIEIVMIDFTHSIRQAGGAASDGDLLAGTAELSLGSQFAPGSENTLWRRAAEFGTSSAAPLPFDISDGKIIFPEDMRPQLDETGNVNLHMSSNSESADTGARNQVRAYVYGNTIGHAGGGL